MIKSDLAPPPGAFIHRFCVAPADIDAQGHANNVVWVRWVNEAAVAHSEAVGFGPITLLRALSLLWVVRRHEMEYLVPAMEGDELEAVTWPQTLGGVTCVRNTLFLRGRRLLARSETTWALVAPNGKLRRVPPEILVAYGSVVDPDWKPPGAAGTPSVSPDGNRTNR
jgi:acyl-CoA thioester hydrolase